MQVEFTRELAGRPLTLEFGGVAKQANGSVLVRYGETVVLGYRHHEQGTQDGDRLFPAVS